MQFFIHHITDILFLVLLLVCSGFFSGTESALFSLSKSQIRQLREKGHCMEKILGLLANNPSGLLVALLFGNLVVNILYFSISTVLGMEIGAQYGEGWQAVAGIAVLLLIILLGEILPKAMGITYPERVARLNSGPLLGWFHFMGPVRKGLEAITRRVESGDTHHAQRIGAEELRMLIDCTHHDSSFGRQEKAIVEDIVNLPEVRVRELMVPRVQQFFRRAEAPAGEALEEAVEHGVELIPIYEGDEDNVVGVVEVRDLFVSGDPSRPLSDFSLPIAFVPEAKRADQMLQEFLGQNLRMVCVVDEYGGLAGTVCLEDLLEEVVGEFDVMDVPAVEQLGETTYRLQGSLGIREWRSLFVGFVPREMVQGLALDTLSGLVISLLKHLPRVGDVAQVGNLRFTVEQVRSNRIELVRLELEGAGEDAK